MKTNMLAAFVGCCLSFSCPLWGQQNGVHCGCPTKIELAQYNYFDCARPLSFVLRWDPSVPPPPDYLLQNVEVALQNVGTIVPCPGVVSFPYHCPDRYISLADRPACYTNTGNVSPSGTLHFQNGLTCTYTNGNLSAHAPATCPVSCTGVIDNCLSSLTAYARDYLNINSLCRQWNGPCNSASLIYRMGPVSLGTYTFLNNGNQLNVKGGILTEQVKICATEWCDYVFEPDYCLMPLLSVAAFVQTNRHLPGCTPGGIIEGQESFQVEREVKNQQEKIEEIFLHLIALQKQLDGTK